MTESATASSDPLPGAAKTAQPIEKKEVLFHGFPASPGICRGRVLVFGAAHTDFREIDPIPIAASEVDAEVARFQSAIEKTKSEIKTIQDRMQKTIEKRDAKIFDAHLLIVGDKLIHKEVISRIRNGLCNAQSSFLLTIQKYLDAISGTNDTYLNERAGDIRDIANRVLRNLNGGKDGGPSLDNLPENTVVIAHDLTPSDTAMLDRRNILGFAIETGSRTCHTSILARSLRIPAVVGMRNIAGKFANGDEVIVDGFLGMVIRNPSRDTLAFYREKISRKDELYSILQKESSRAAETTDGYRVKLCANIEGADDLEEVSRCGAEGIGLFRTEYLFMNTPVAPDEETQYQIYAKLLRAMRGRAVTIRTVDLGGDKLDFATASAIREPNPFLGLRAIRLCHEKPQLIRTQLRALLRAGTEGDLRIMFPMVSSLSEIEELLAIRDEVMEELKAANIPFDPKVRIGAMIEIPSACLIADALAAKVDFFSIGSNDLVQYTLAVDRLNERVAYLYRPSHPAVMELIRLTVAAAKKHRIPVCVCGEIAADPRFTPILLGLGVLELSMSPNAIAEVRGVIRKTSMLASEQLAKIALTSADPEDVMVLAKEHIQSVAPDIASILG
ncbi:MAG: phosphoenolpyruvate--protein phosphotransferase [Lentisphaeria bacterium]|nr:phosphoenolpyruvate--protein phosphotransferase [Lentisphaeria bacterium]